MLSFLMGRTTSVFATQSGHSRVISQISLQTRLALSSALIAIAFVQQSGKDCGRLTFHRQGRMNTLNRKPVVEAAVEAAVIRFDVVETVSEAVWN
ncbi:hypothetical protein K432DRAFT_45528 [Lepidopterella palustris CBS 459.81]|uniref:Uncharacterized protein n=1 Tax=Lepidopterella palustris CBS 459.81 TaxID=1314670 RepID=A0A8E2EAA1_9PEZI|nr:hypothetical protein K432DRAFT_45528 [Lepidopterella palustris CBS 459.81]